MSNPLVAQPKSSTQSFSGVPLLESANDLKKAVESGDWASVAMGAVGTALDALGMAMDPFGAILAAGVGWLMEHVGPLKEALDGLAGDPDQIAANSETWKNIATELGAIGSDMGGMVTGDIVSWQGEAADAYRQRAQDTATLLTAAQQGADGASSGVKTAGEVVAAVRSLVRDIIAELVGHLISWALQVVFTLGIGLAWVVPQVVAEVAKVASKLADLVKRLVQALKALVPMLKKLGSIFEDAAKALKNIKGGKPAPSATPKDLPGGPKDIGTPKGGDGSTTPSGTPKGGDGSTTPSGAKGGGDGPPPKADVPPPKADGPASPSGSGGSGSPGAPPKPDKGPGDGSTSSSGSNKPSPPRDRALGPDDRVCKSDPVDIATGEMILGQRDLELPGLLELVLERTHVSSYRAGHRFGFSWSSTVDQRLEVDDENICYFSPDGMVLVYPLPAPETPVMPLEGPRWPITLERDSTYVIEDPKGKRHLRFAASAGPRRQVFPLLAVENFDGDRIDIDYDGLGVPVLVRHSDGYRVGIQTESGRVTGIRMLRDGGAPDVVVMRYRYDERGRLTEVINSSGVSLRFDYDDSGRIIGWRDRNGVWYRYSYDADGRCVRTVGDRGFYDGTFVYDRERLVTTHTDSLGHTTEFHLNPANQVLREVDPLGNATEFEWDRFDRLLSRTDPLGRVTRYEYGLDGAMTAVLRPDGSYVEMHQGEDVALAVSVSDDDGFWQHTYDGPDVPDPATAQIGVASPLRYAALKAKDPADEPGIAVADLFGRPSKVTNAAGGQTHLSWTIEGRRASRIRPLGGRELWRYDNEGNEVEHIDALGLRRRTEYGPFDLPFATVDQTGARTTYEYDTELRLIAVTNPHGLVWHYAYDRAGRLVEETNFDGRTLRFAYDAAGQLRRSVNGLGEVTEFDYDVLGQVIERRTPSGTTTYTYDPLGRLKSATGPDVVLVCERDEYGRMITESVNGRGVTFSYSTDGTEKRRRTPSGVDSVWTYGETDAPETLTTAGHTLRFRHDQGGREIQRSVDDTVVLTQSFTTEHQLSSQIVAGGQGRIVQQRSFDYRLDGQLVGLRDTVSGAVRLTLDPAGRITEVTAPDRRESYRYDATGNLAASELGPLHYHGNTLSSAGDVTFKYDAQGRMVLRRQGNPRTGEQVWLYTWDCHDRLTGVITPDGTRWRYRYDPIGRRIAKQRLAPQPAGTEPVVAEQIEFVWDGSLLIEQVHTGADGVAQVTTWDYHPVDHRPLTQVESDGRFHSIITDVVGTPTELIDAGGSLVWHNRSSLWGQVVAIPGAGTPLRFPGQYADPETRLHYNVYRYYDPAVGRYVSQDPLGLGPAPNPVAYAANPYLDADPLGLMCSGGGSGGSPDVPGAGTDPAKAKPSPPPIKPKPDELKGNPTPKPPPPPIKPKPDELKGNPTPKPEAGPPVPDKAPNRNGAKTFGKDTAGGEKYELSADGTKVKIYRFGDKNKTWDWESRSRQDSNGNFAEPADMNSWAIKQSSFGSGSDNPTKNPFISVATDHESLSHSNDPWVQKIIKESPDVRVMEVPPEALMRPRPTKPISKEETEWLFYDGDAKMETYHSEWVPNPYKK